MEETTQKIEDVVAKAEASVIQIKSEKKVFYAEVGFEDIPPEPTGFWKHTGLSGALTTISFILLSIISANTVATELFIQSSTYVAVMAQSIPDTIDGKGFFDFIARWTPAIVLVCAPGFELFLASHGFSKARESGKTSFSIWDLIAPMSVLVFSGLSRSLILTSPDSWIYPFVGFVRFVMEIATAVGAPISAYVSATIFATLFNKYDADNKTIYEAWKADKDAVDKEYSKWQTKNSHIYQINVDKRQRQYTPEAEEKRASNVNITQLVKEFLARESLTAHQVGEGTGMKSSDLAEKIGISDPAGMATVRQVLSQLRNKPQSQKEK